jgi:uncharacterized iron-regulated protein
VFFRKGIFVKRWKKFVQCLLALCVSVFFSGTVFASAPDTAPLAGRIWNAREARFVSAEELVREVSLAKIVLLGETHDNRVHHELQLFLLKEMLVHGLRPALLMEQFDREFQGAITDEEERINATVESVFKAGHFSERWGAENYRPLLTLAFAYGLPIVAANLSRDEMCAIIRDPSSVTLPKVDPQVEVALTENIKHSHGGGSVDPELLAGVMKSQRARDAMMAETLERNALRGAVLIAGAGHVRRDRGVPLYLNHQSLAVGFIEVDPSFKTAPEYLNGTFASEKSFDYVWFTERVEHVIPPFSGFCK